MAETLVLRGTMKGHADMVTAIATPGDNPDDMIVSSSRDKSVVVWQLTKEEGTYGVPRRRLTGHSHFVQDVVVSWDGQLALSGSWDGELRLWDTNTGATIRRFVGHTEDVITVALSMDNRQIWSATSNGTIKLWNTLGECKYTFEHTMIKPWDRTLAVSPDRSLGASGGKDEVTLVWDLAKRKKLYSLDAGDATTHALCFSPMKHWLCTATEDSVKIWDLESKSIIQELKPETTETPTTTTTTTTTTTGNNQMPYCTSLSWRGSTLFTGYSDGTIRAWGFQ